MGKKEKSSLALAEDFKALITMIPKLETFMKVHSEIAAGYQKYRKNGGDPISGIEKHLAVKIQKSELKAKKEVVAPVTEATPPKECTKAKKSTKAVKK